LEFWITRFYKLLCDAYDVSVALALLRQFPARTDSPLHHGA